MNPTLRDSAPAESVAKLKSGRPGASGSSAKSCVFPGRICVLAFARGQYPNGTLRTYFPPDEEIALAIDSLPAAPRILAELGPRLQRADVEVDDVAEVLRQDPGLTARLIFAANSAAYTGTEPSRSLEDAVARIGFREAFRLIGAAASAKLSDGPLSLYAMPLERLRQNALFTALVMEELAPGAEMEPRAAYTVGLLRSVGKLVLNRLAAQHPELAPYGGTAEPLGDWEAARFGYANPQFSAYVLEKWRFPAETVAAVREHYHPDEHSSVGSHLLNLAAGAAEMRDFGFPGEAEYWQFTPESFKIAKADEGKVVWAGERAHRTLLRISSALG